MSLSHGRRHDPGAMAAIDRPGGSGEPRAPAQRVWLPHAAAQEFMDAGEDARWSEREPTALLVGTLGRHNDETWYDSTCLPDATVCVCVSAATALQTPVSELAGTR